jgi:hypothetical protein
MKLASASHSTVVVNEVTRLTTQPRMKLLRMNSELIIGLSPCLRRIFFFVTMLLLTACGGGGGSGDTPAAVEPIPSAHAAPTAAVSVATAPHLAAQAYAAFVALRWWGVTLPWEISKVSPTSPNAGYLCGGEGSMSIVYTDSDKDGSVSPGDVIAISSPRCIVTAFGGGTTTVTVLAANANGITDARVRVEGTMQPQLRAYGWAPTLTGTLRVTAFRSSELLIRSEGTVRILINATEWLDLSNVALSVSRVGVGDSGEGGMDISMNTVKMSESRFQFETVDGAVVAGGVNEAPYPGSIVLRGTAGSQSVLTGSFGDLGAQFRLRTDVNGAGVYASDVTVGDAAFFGAL